MWLSRKTIMIFSGRKNRDKGNSTMRDKRDNMKDKTGFAIWYEKTVGKLIPKQTVISLISCFVLNSVIYTGTQILMKNAKHYDLSTKFDKELPFVKEWIYVYLICFAFWAVNYIMISRTKKEHWYKFATGDYLSRIICGVFFILLPTTNARPEVTGNGLSSILMRFIYTVDPATDLFPSIHCLVSWMCFIGIRKQKHIPAWYKAFSAVFAIMVFASTQFTKQHYIVDVFAGVAIAELSYFIGTHTDLYKKIWKVFDKVNYIVFGRE